MVYMYLPIYTHFLFIISIFFSSEFIFLKDITSGTVSNSIIAK